MDTVFKSDNVLFKYDSSTNTFFVQWSGKVPTNEFKDVIMYGAKKIRDSNDYFNIILDRKSLDEFSPESRVWLKQDFMRNDGKVLIKKVRKLAAVKATTIFASVITSVFSAMFQIANPELKYRVFDDLAAAESWVYLNEEQAKKKFLDRIMGLFRTTTVSELG